MWPRDLSNPQWDVQRQTEEENHFKKTPGKNDMKDHKAKNLSRAQNRNMSRPAVGRPLPGGVRGMSGKLACLDLLLLTD